ncbi:MAG: hypothetical protein ACJ8F3_03700 [Xanthobacteraceae bacterium]
MSEYRSEFVHALRSGKNMRESMFRVLEERHAADFANGPAGVKYYNDLLETVRTAEVPEATDEFLRRFTPLLDPDGKRARAATPEGKKARAERRVDVLWVAIACAALIITSIVVGLHVRGNTPAATTPEAKPGVDATETSTPAEVTSPEKVESAPAAQRDQQ